MQYTADQIIALAPDASSAKSGRSLATPAKWQNIGCDDRALWGECQGSGARPYQVAIDLNEPAFKCSCPSRKFPCKHSLGLFLLVATSPSVSTSNIPPDWVAEWLSKREQQQQRKEERAARSADEEVDDATLAKRESQKAKRALNREAKVNAGLQELELWLRDLVRAGLAAVPTRPISYWNQIAARMIDAQAPGVARRLHEMSGVHLSTMDWTRRLLAQLGSLYLLVKAYQRIESLPAPTQADVRTAIGWTYKEDELDEDSIVRDEWLVLGQRLSGDEMLRVRRTWLCGRQTQRGALLLEFAAAGQQLPLTYISGTCVDAELLFYPGNFPLRAFVKNRFATSPILKTGVAYANLDQLMLGYAEGLSLNPWLETIPVSLESVIPVRREERWFARDSGNKLLPLKVQFNQGWQLAAISGNHPVHLFAEWNGRSLLPLSVRAEGRFIEL